MATDTNTTKTVGLLVEASKLDTVYRDLYLKQARQSLSAISDESAYRSIGQSSVLNKSVIRLYNTATRSVGGNETPWLPRF